jgi:hypothetical protein
VSEGSLRQLRVGPDLGDQLAPLVRIRQAERMGDGTAGEDIPELVGPARPFLADDVDGLRGQPPIQRPLEQEVRHGFVEDLVGRGGRPEHVVVDSPQSHRRADRLRGRVVGPGIRRDQQRALRVRVQSAHPVEQLPAGRPGHRLPREHERHVLARVPDGRQLLQRRLGLAERLDPVVETVAMDEPGLDRIEDVRIFVDDDQQGEGHRLQTYLGVFAAAFVSQTETCPVLSLVNGSRCQPLQRSRSSMPASCAIRSSSTGHT